MSHRALRQAFAVLLSIFPAGMASAQSPAPKLEFEVASVRQNKTGGKSSMNVSPTSGPDFVPTGGIYSAKNIVLAQYIAFAYTLTNKQLQAVVAQTPWTTEDQFDIEARAAANTTKDQFRLMMQSLLADRFKLAVHFETREVPIYALVQVKPGRLGPHLRLHQANDPVCDAPPATVPSPIPVDAEGFPLYCGGPIGMQPSAPGRMKTGGRDVPLARFAAITAPGVGAVDRPVTDKTGLPGTVDFTLEWQQVAQNVRPGQEFHPDESAPPFAEALKEQLGLKLIPDRGLVEFFVVDHVEHPSAN
jgi:uncharacterized protein (TIGR03435 family)